MPHLSFSGFCRLGKTANLKKETFGSNVISNRGSFSPIIAVLRLQTSHRIYGNVATLGCK